VPGVVGFALLNEENKCICMCPGSMGESCDLNYDCGRYVFELVPIQETKPNELDKSVDGLNKSMSDFSKAVLNVSKRMKEPIREAKKLNDAFKSLTFRS